MKRSQIKRRPLADSVLKMLEPEAREYRELDASGLYFRVKPNNNKSWVLRYKRPNGKWAWKGLGGFPAVSGKAARKLAQDLQDLGSDGEDLQGYTVTATGIQKVEPGVQAVLFRDAGEDWYQSMVLSGRDAQTLYQYRTSLDKDIYPVIGDKPLDQVTRADCTKIQANVESRGAYAVAGKVRRRLNTIFSRAIAQGVCEMNPASELKVMAQQGIEEKQHPHLLEDALPAFLKALRQSRSRWITLAMVRLILRTACRPGMARWAEWSEFDLDNALWVSSAEKMKTKVAHTIPLATQTVEDLRALHELTGLNRYLFPGMGSVNPVASENTVNKALRLIGYKDKLVGHGARHTASTLLNEHGWNFRVVDAQLAHKIEGTEGVYNKAVYLTQRQAMMQWFADYLDWLEFGGKKPADPA